MRGSALHSLSVMAALCAAGCTVTAGPGLDELGHESDDGDDDDGGGEAAIAPLSSILAGQFAPLTGYTGIGGRAQMARQLDGATRVDLQITGLPAGIEMTAHVHALPCAFQGGGHYKIDPAVVDPIEENELWLHLATSAEGIGATSALFPHLTRGDAMSIVVHDPATAAKMACADLVDDADAGGVLMLGYFSPFAQAEEVDSGIGGAVDAFRVPDATDISMVVGGLDPSQVYAAHVHALPCGVLDGGGHYKIDPTVVDTIAENEIWPDVSGIASGLLVSETSFAHGIRADAQSVVLHRVVGDTKPKVACADLQRLDNAPLVTEGDAVLLLAGGERTPDLAATAAMVRTLGGTTEVYLAAAGLAAGATYPVHVHDLPCSISDGGGHYLIDPAVGAAEANEIWLPITADDAGEAWTEVAAAHLARPEAQSIVIHDPVDKARLACIDLE
jgi:hypothetical protein